MLYIMRKLIKFWIWKCLRWHGENWSVTSSENCIPWKNELKVKNPKNSKFDSQCFLKYTSNKLETSYWEQSWYVKTVTKSKTFYHKARIFTFPSFADIAFFQKNEKTCLRHKKSLSATYHCIKSSTYL